MKKRLITLFLAFTVCLTMTIPAFANGNCESDSEISVSEDLSAQMNLPCTYCSGPVKTTILGPAKTTNFSPTKTTNPRKKRSQPSLGM